MNNNDNNKLQNKEDHFNWALTCYGNSGDTVT